jgi:hypothetical protein
VGKFDKCLHFLVGFEVRTAESMKMAVFWIALLMEAATTSESSVNFNQTTRHYNPEDSHIFFHFLSIFLAQKVIIGLIIQYILLNIIRKIIIPKPKNICLYSIIYSN